MNVTKEVQFDLAHRITNHKAKCRNLHGHTYKVQVTVAGDLIDEQDNPSEGMVIDFKDLKAVIDAVIVEPCDHATMLWINDPLVPYFKEMQKVCGIVVHYVDFPPTAENMAKFFFDGLYRALWDTKVEVKSVKVWETPTSFAEYTDEMERAGKDENADTLESEKPCDRCGRTVCDGCEHQGE